VLGYLDFSADQPKYVSCPFMFSPMSDVGLQMSCVIEYPDCSADQPKCASCPFMFSPRTIDLSDAGFQILGQDGQHAHVGMSMASAEYTW